MAVYEFVCVKTGCELEDITVTRIIGAHEIDEQLCEKCYEKLKRIWSFSGGISTSDGFKGR